jgi:hypothetical protein
MEQSISATPEIDDQGNPLRQVAAMAKRTGKSRSQPRERNKLPLETRVILLTESGYKCAVPICRGILALDMHHIWEVSAGGGDDPSNLIALCPTCHAMYHRGTIKQESIYLWKAMLVAMTRAFDLQSIDMLLFLETCKRDFLIVSGDGALHFGRLVAGGLASIDQKANNNWQFVTYAVNISEKGRQLVHAWKQGNRIQLRKILGEPSSA